jgi:triacylglycerol esterase/lipase EstA (alpha/beta hydrolase family)
MSNVDAQGNAGRCALRGAGRRRRAGGYCVYAFNYGATLASLEVWPFIGPRIDALGHIEKSAEELSSFVNNVLSKTKASKVDLVGHSQGGMMPNYYIKDLGGATKVNELIGLAPSNHGTTLDGLTKLVEVPVRR